MNETTPSFAAPDRSLTYLHYVLQGPYGVTPISRVSIPGPMLSTPES